MIFDSTEGKFNISSVKVSGVKIERVWYIDTELKLVKAYKYPYIIKDDKLVSVAFVGELEIIKQDEHYDYYWNLI